MGDGCGSGLIEIFLDLEVGDLDVNDRLVVGACEGDGDDMRRHGCSRLTMPWLLLCSC